MHSEWPPSHSYCASGSSVQGLQKSGNNCFTVSIRPQASTPQQVGEQTVKVVQPGCKHSVALFSSLFLYHVYSNEAMPLPIASYTHSSSDHIHILLLPHPTAQIPFLAPPLTAPTTLSRPAQASLRNLHTALGVKGPLSSRSWDGVTRLVLPLGY